MTRLILAAAAAVFATGAAIADESDEPSEASEAAIGSLEDSFAAAGFGYIELPPFLTDVQVATLMSIMEDPALDNSEREIRITELIEDAQS